MLKKILTVSLLILLLLAGAGCGKKYMNLRGRVVDEFTGEPLGAVEVEVGDRVVETDLNGYFSVKDIPVVEDVPIEDRMVKVSVPGYRTYAQPIALEEGDKKIEVKLKSKKETEFFFVSDKGGSKNIYLTDVYSNQSTKLTDKGDNWAPAWSTIRKEVVFLSNRDGDNNIYTMKADGSNVKQITHTSTDKADPVWLGENKILFASNRDGDYELYVTDLQGMNLQRLTKNDRYDGQADYSTARNEIAYISNTTGKDKLHLLIMDNQRKLILNKGFGKDKVPAWSYKGDKIFFVTVNSGTSTFRQIKPNGSAVKEVLEVDGEVFDYTLSGAEDKFILYEVKGEESKNLRLVVPSGEERKVMTDKDINYTEPEWKN